MPHNEDHPIAIRAKISDGAVTAKVLITHPMEADTEDQMGNKAKPTPHFIQEIVCRVGERIVLTALWGGNVARDPYLAFKFRGAKPGDLLTLHWVDNLGHRHEIETEIT
jgi:sulfur-oxidizing protein SoxZ